MFARIVVVIINKWAIVKTQLNILNLLEEKNKVFLGK